jgi:tetratricopeptide (TPR) repeat protein
MNPETETQPAHEEARPAANCLRTWLPALLLIVATFIAYQPVWHAGFIWDDDNFLTEHPAITGVNFKNPDALYRLWFTESAPDYYPLTFSLWWLEWHLWGNNALGYHLVNVLLLALSSVVLWRILLRLKIPGALLAAAIFALHPVNVESAAWISEGKNTLCMFFFTLTILFWVKFDDSRRRFWYGLALAAFALSMLGKSAGAPLPVALLGLIWWQRGRLERKDVLKVAPFFALSLAICCITVWFHMHLAIGKEVVRTDSFWSRLAGAGWAILFYFYKAILPFKLTFVYPAWRIDAGSALAYVPLLLLTVVLVLLWYFRQRWGRGPFIGFAYYVLMLLPVLGFLNIYYMRFSPVADHWQYFAIIGPIVLLASVIRRPLIAAPLLLVLGFLTWKQCGMYASAETLWQTTVERNPDSWLAHLNLGVILDKQGKTDDAISHYESALRSNPGTIEAGLDLGVDLLKTGQTDAAISRFQKVLEIAPDNEQAHNSLGDALMQRGAVDEAIPHFQRAIEINPGYSKPYNNLGEALLKKGNLNGALNCFEKAAEVNPDLPEAQFGLGNCLARAGRMDEAIAHYEKALQLNPDFGQVHLNLANALMKQGRMNEAISHFQRAQDLDPNNAMIPNNLAWLLATCPDVSLRDGAKAVALAKRANELSGGNNPAILQTLAAAFAEAGQFSDAIDTAQRGLQFASDQSNPRLTAQLQYALSLYQSGSSFHLPDRNH